MYQEHILENYRDPLNFGKLENATSSNQEFNPLCGDVISMQLIVEDAKIKDVKFFGKGCAISIASASLLTEKIKGMDIKDVEDIVGSDILDLLEIPISSGRDKCAFLSLKTLRGALI
jgi:nitrogen fixation NifU-like protein